MTRDHEVNPRFLDYLVATGKHENVVPALAAMGVDRTKAEGWAAQTGRAGRCSEDAAVATALALGLSVHDVVGRTDLPFMDGASPYAADAPFGDYRTVSDPRWGDVYVTDLAGGYHVFPIGTSAYRSLRVQLSGAAPIAFFETLDGLVCGLRPERCVQIALMHDDTDTLQGYQGTVPSPIDPVVAAAYDAEEPPVDAMDVNSCPDEELRETIASIIGHIHSSKGDDPTDYRERLEAPVVWIDPSGARRPVPFEEWRGTHVYDAVQGMLGVFAAPGRGDLVVKGEGRTVRVPAHNVMMALFSRDMFLEALSDDDVVSLETMIDMSRD